MFGPNVLPVVPFCHLEHLKKSNCFASSGLPALSLNRFHQSQMLEMCTFSFKLEHIALLCRFDMPWSCPGCMLCAELLHGILQKLEFGRSNIIVQKGRMQQDCVTMVGGCDEECFSHYCLFCTLFVIWLLLGREILLTFPPPPPPFLPL